MSSIIRVIIHNITRMLHLESIYSTKARILNHGFHGAPARPRPRDTWTCGLVKVNTVLLCDAGLAARLDGSEDAAHLLVHRRYIKPLDVCGCSHRLIEWSERLDAGCRRCHGFHENWVVTSLTHGSGHSKNLLKVHA